MMEIKIEQKELTGTTHVSQVGMQTGGDLSGVHQSGKMILASAVQLATSCEFSMIENM